MMKLSNSLSHNLSLQLSTNVALDQGVEYLFDTVKNNEDRLNTEKFMREIKNWMLKANKKSYFRSKLPPEYFLRSNPTLLEQAIQMAANRHEGEYRDSGAPYLAHVLSTGFILARLGLPKEVVLAGILHDAIEDLGDKNKILNELHAMLPAIAYYVYSVSGPDIKDAVEKDKVLYSRISSHSVGNLYPKVIKCADGIANLYDLEHMAAKDGRSAIQRQQRFLEKVKETTLEFAAETDRAALIPLRKGTEIFSLHEYVSEMIAAKMPLS